MKKFYLLLSAALLMGFTSCSKDDDNDPVNNPGKTEEPGGNSNGNGDGNGNGNGDNNGNGNGNNGGDNTPATYDWTKVKTWITYVGTGSSESYKYENEYDSKGRVIECRTYMDGSLHSKARSYVYDGKKVIYHTEGYGIESYDVEEIYHDDNYLKMKLMAHYQNGQQTLLNEYTYDSQGRETGSSVSSNGVVSYKTRNYTYNGKEATYYIDYYYNGSVSFSTKCKKVYLDDNWIKYTSHIYYESTTSSKESNKTEYKYDNEGRETGYTTYSNGQMVIKNRDYKYNGKELTYIVDIYSNGSLYSSNKTKRIYY